ncbi:uncharacterized protein LOC117518160 [Thalassophryne amazonica]|uniref:uncharacterized protein LOC117518160 n=1 Tax=Thalassophryne amazonica TaxID=390379 RepID=UPI001471C9DA|nr:uncharacterized protein LOC117518160 [Thalassophryne amazonica]
MVKTELSQKAKLSLYQSICTAILTCDHEVWVKTKRIRSRMQVVEMRCCHQVSRAKLLDMVRSSTIQEGLRVEALLLRIRKRQLRWFRYLVRMPPGHLSGGLPGLETSTSLQVLQLSFNKISTLQPEDLSHLSQLKELHVQHNFITTLHPQTFQGLEQLRVLDLSYNLLTSLHPVMYLSLHNIGADVRLNGNLWRCDCTMRNLRRWLTYNISRGLQAWNVVCASPSTLSGRDVLQVEEGDFNCSSAENKPELYRDVTVDIDSDILLSCSAEASAADQTQYDNDAYSIGEEYEELESPRERRVTFSSTDFYDTEAGGNQEEAYSYARKKHDKHNTTDAKYRPEKDQHRAGEAATNERKARDLSHVSDVSYTDSIEYEHISDPGEAMERISLSSHSDSSRSGKILKNEQVAHQHHSSQVEENPAGQRDIFTKVVQKEAFSSHDSCETSGFSREHFAKWPSLKNIKPGDPDLWQENGEQFEFSDSVKNDSARSSVLFTSDDSNQIIMLQSHQRKDLDLSSSSSYMSDDEPTHYTVNPEPLEDTDITTQKSLQRYNQSDYKQQTPSLPSIKSSSSESEEETGGYKKEIQQKVVVTATSPIKEHQTASHDTEIRWPTLHLGHITHTKRHLDIKAPSTPSRSSSSETEEKSMKKWEQRQVVTGKIPFKQPFTPSDSCSSTDSEEETTDYKKKKQQMELGITKSPLMDNQTTCHDSEITWPTLDLGHVTPIKRRLDIKAPSLHSTSSSSSEEETDYIKKQRQKKEDLPKFSLKKSRSSSHDPEIKWPSVDLDHITPSKRRLDIKAPSPPSRLSSSNDSETETKMQVQREVNIANSPLPPSDSSCSNSEEETEDIKGQKKVDLPRSLLKESQSSSHDAVIRWPTLNLYHIRPIKRHLDIKAPSHSSSSSDSDEETDYRKRKGQKELEAEMFPLKEAPCFSDAQTGWPTIDLGHITHINRHLDFKIPSPSSPSSSSSDSDQDPREYMKKHEQKEVEAKNVPPNKSPYYNETATRWPTTDIGHITPIKRGLDIKVVLPVVESCSSSDSEEAPTDYRKTKDQKEVEAEMFPLKEAPCLSDAQTGWPTIELGHITPINRHLDFKIPSPSSPSSSSDSDQDLREYMKKHKQKEVETKNILLKSPSYNHETETRWPTIDLGHITPIKRRLNIKVALLPVDSSSSSDSDEGTIKKQREVGLTKLPFKESQTASSFPETRWPALDEHPVLHKNIKPVDPDLWHENGEDSDTSSSSSYISDEGQMGVRTESHSSSQDPEIRWPKVDLGHITPIKKHLDIKVALSPVDSSSSSESEEETKRQKDVGLRKFPFKESESASSFSEMRWPALDHRITPVKRHLDIIVSSSPETTINIKEVIEVVGFPVKESQTISHQERQPVPAKHVSSVPSSSQSSESNSSSSASEDEDKANKANLNMKIPGISKTTEATRSINSHDKTDYIKLEKPTLIMDKVETKSSAENINLVPEVSPELQSRWAAMNLASSRIRKRLDMTIHKSPVVPASVPPDSPGSSNSKNVNKNERSRQKRWELGTQGIKNAESSLISKDRPVLLISKEADGASPQSSDSSSSSENEDESLGLVGREWRGKAQLAGVTDKGLLNQTSQDRSQTQNKEVKQKATAELEGQTSKADEPDSVWLHQCFTNIPPVKILATKTMSQRVSSLHSKEYHIMDHTKTDISDTRFTSHETVNSAKAGSSHGVRDVNTSSMTFDDAVKRRTEQSRETLDVDQRLEIRWTSVGHHLPDLSLSRQRRYMAGNHLTLQQGPPAGSEHQRLNSSSSSSSESEGKQATADTLQMHKYSDFTANKGIYKFDNLSNVTSEVVSREDGGEKKGLSALKAMSSERNKWEKDEDLRKSASHKYGDQASTIQSATNFNYLSSVKDIQMLTKQSLPDSLQSSSVDDKRALELLYHIPQYRTHVFRTPPPPRLDTPPPDEAPSLTWRSQHSFNKQNWRSVSPYLQQRGMEESEQSSPSS